MIGARYIYFDANELRAQRSEQCLELVESILESPQVDTIVIFLNIKKLGRSEIKTK